ncbi:hypothetical protein SARC_18188, partial [Sphaeroforma arctica JP610]
MQGIYFESQGRYDEALKCYDVYLGEDELNQPIIKRKVTVARAQGDRTGAIE